MYRINEAIYGNMATVFHRTRISNLVNQVYTSGFKPGSGDMYGRGFYSTYDIESQERENMANTYGNIIVKFAVSVQNFIFFDLPQFLKSPVYRAIVKDRRLTGGEKISRQNYIQLQMEYFGIPGVESIATDLARLDSNATSDIALKLKSLTGGLHKYVDGIVFTGRRDGRVLVAFNTKLIIPLSFRIDGEKDFEPVDRNMDYLRQWSKNKIQPLDKSAYAVDDHLEQMRLILTGKSRRKLEDFSDIIELSGGSYVSGNSIFYEFSSSNIGNGSDLVEKYIEGDDYYEIYDMEAGDFWDDVLGFMGDTNYGAKIKEAITKAMREENPEKAEEFIETLQWSEASEIEDEFYDVYQAVETAYSRAMIGAAEGEFMDKLYDDYKEAITESLGKIVEMGETNIVELDTSLILEAVEYTVDDYGEEQELMISEYVEYEIDKPDVDMEYWEPYAIPTADQFWENLEL